MKGKLDPYVLWPLAKKLQNWIVEQSTARNFTVYKREKKSWGPFRIYQQSNQHNQSGPIPLK